MKATKTIKTWCPIFSGFYGTHWEMDEPSEIESYNQEYNTSLDYDDYDYDYKQYMVDVCTSFVYIFNDKIKEIIPSIKEVILEEVRSPREYNFANDSIDIEMKCTNQIHKDIRDYLIKYAKEWGKYLHERYTSCSGFISSYPNYAEGWINETKDYDDLNSHYLGSILEFISKNEEFEEFEDFYYDVMENVYVGNYMTPKIPRIEIEPAIV